jgi:endoglucanase
MKKLIYLLLPAIILTSINSFSQKPYGVNLAGAEFGENMPGIFGQDYTYPTANELDYYQSKGLKLVRLPFKWERIQHNLNGSLDADELLRIKTFVQSAADRNMVVILDLHNYCRYKLNNTEEIIGSNNLTIENITDLWSKLSLEFNNTPNIWGYGIMNEPHDLLSNASLFEIAQSIINGIRIGDQNTKIIVGGDSWSSAERWMEYSANLKDLSDASNNLIFEAHVYFDQDGSGTYNQDYDSDGAYPDIGIVRVTPFLDWLETNNLNGFIGEYGVPNDDSRWLTVLDNFLNHLHQNCINGTYWAGGPWWGVYPLSIEPNNGNDSPQMSIVENYPTTCPGGLSIQDLSIAAYEFKTYPNPFNNYIFIDGLNEGVSLGIYDLQGRLIITRTLKNKTINDLDILKKGIYFITYNNSLIAKIIK